MGTGLASLQSADLISFHTMCADPKNICCSHLGHLNRQLRCGLLNSVTAHYSPVMPKNIQLYWLFNRTTHTYNTKLEMWANAQRDGRPTKYRWRPLFNAAKFGWCPLVECHAVTLPRRETHWNLQGCLKLANRKNRHMSTEYRPWKFGEDRSGRFWYLCSKRSFFVC